MSHSRSESDEKQKKGAYGFTFKVATVWDC